MELVFPLEDGFEGPQATPVPWEQSAAAASDSLYALGRLLAPATEAEAMVRHARWFSSVGQRGGLLSRAIVWRDLVAPRQGVIRPARRRMHYLRRRQPTTSPVWIDGCRRRFQTALRTGR